MHPTEQTSVNEGTSDCGAGGEDLELNAVLLLWSKFDHPGMAQGAGDAASAITPLGLLHLRPLQSWYNSLHMDPRLNRWVRVRVTHKCLIHLRRWRDSTLSSVPVRREVVTHDASLHGWGRWGRRGNSKEFEALSGERAAHQCPRTRLSTWC